MFQHVGESVHKHPYLWTGGAVVAGVLLIVILFTGNTAPPAPTVGVDHTADELNAQTTMAQISAQVAGQGIAADLNKTLAITAAQLEAAKGDTQARRDSDALQAQIAQLQITSQADTQKLISTLSAQVAIGQTNAQVEMERIASATTISTTGMLADVQKFYQASVEAMARDNNATVDEMNRTNVAGMVGMHMIDANLTAHLSDLDATKTYATLSELAHKDDAASSQTYAFLNFLNANHFQAAA